MRTLLLIVLLGALVAAAYCDNDNDILDKIKLAPKYKAFIEKFGENAWHFLECMGVDWAEQCIPPTIKCVEAKDILGCLDLIVCEAKDVKDCIDKLKQ